MAPNGFKALNQVLSDSDQAQYHTSANDIMITPTGAAIVHMQSKASYVTHDLSKHLAVQINGSSGNLTGYPQMNEQLETFVNWITTQDNHNEDEIITVELLSQGALIFSGEFYTFNSVTGFVEMGASDYNQSDEFKEILRKRLKLKNQLKSEGMNIDPLPVVLGHIINAFHSNHPAGFGTRHTWLN